MGHLNDRVETIVSKDLSALPQYGEVFNPWRLFHGAYVPEAILRGRVSRGAALLYGVLGRFAGANGRAWPKYATLAVALGVPCPGGGEARSVRRWTHELVTKGLIRTTQRGAQTNSLQFEFLWSPLLEGQLQLDFGETKPLTNRAGRRRANTFANTFANGAKPVENLSISSDNSSDTRPPLAGPDRPELAGHSPAVLISEQESLEQESPVVEKLVDCSEAETRAPAEPGGSPGESSAGSSAELRNESAGAQENGSSPLSNEPKAQRAPETPVRQANSKILPFARGLMGAVGPSGHPPTDLDPEPGKLLQRVSDEFSHLGRKLEEARRLEGMARPGDILKKLGLECPPTD